MDYRYLKAFLLTAKHRNFTRAAAELRIAQSAVSRQIRLLEESIGSQLLFRSPQQVLLTPAGEDLFKQAGNFNSWFDDYFHNTTQTIRIGTLPGVLENWLVKRLLEIPESELPNLSLQTNSVSKITEDLQDGKLDIGIISKKIDNEIISSRKTFDEEFLLISKKKVELKSLHEHRWIYAEKGGYLDRTSKKVSHKYIQVNSISTLLKMVESGLGIAIVASHIVGEKYKLVRQPLDKLKGSIYLCMPNYHVIPGYLKSFVKMVFY